MRTEKQIEAWLRLKINNFQARIGGKTSYCRIGLKRLRTQLKQILDQLDEYLEERKEAKDNESD